MKQPASTGGSGLKDLRNKVLFTFFILGVYRIGVHIPLPGIDGQALSEFFAGAEHTLFGLFDMFAGGGLKNFSIFALGIMPYISASIIMQLLTVVSPTLSRWKKDEGEAGRKKITQWTRYGTVMITLVQGMGISVGLEQMTSPDGASVVIEGGWAFRLTTVFTLTAGTIFIMWLGERITARGLGNGISLIIFAGIVAGFPGALANVYQLFTAGELTLFMGIFVLAIVVGVLLFIVFVERGQRRLPIHYAKRMMGRKMYGGQTSHLPLKLNTSGVIPAIFASSILMFPATIASFSQAGFLEMVANHLQPESLVYNLIFVALIIFFCFFYTAIIFDPKDIAENLKKQGGFIPGIRPGLRTKEYIDAVLSRLTFSGSIYLSLVCVLPVFMIREFNVPFYYGGTALLIVVVVAMDTMSQFQSHLISRHYEGLMTKTRIKGRR
ncbi:preprotein translocase subunit SecY [Desulfonatronospira sp.]|uniref:preprotein translocase subunit SecY n=1 Tax=Desulfonatronospira sp. TaxID=1962951 RepID=UPI0025C0F915|nr:preprotein translocase subunit SecY [Desulfonatronospira sp.]